jgi:hypothetical protein
MSWLAVVRLLVRLLISVALAWLCVANSQPALAATHQSTQTYTYDGQHSTAADTNTTTERGPPAADDPDAVHGTVGQWSHGPSARPDIRSPSTPYAYDHPLTLVQGDGVAGATEGLVLRRPGGAPVDRSWARCRKHGAWLRRHRHP